MTRVQPIFITNRQIVALVLSGALRKTLRAHATLPSVFIPFWFDDK